MIVHRDEKAVEEFEVELTKKSGKGSGLVLMGYKSGKGAYVSEVVSREFFFSFAENLREKWPIKFYTVYRHRAISSLRIALINFGPIFKDIYISLLYTL